MKKRLLSILVIVGVLISGTLTWSYFNKKKMVVKGSTIIKTGDFNLNAIARWSHQDEKNTLNLEWSEVPDLSQGGYRIYQSGDGGANWEIRSSNYGKRVKVLNIFPDERRSNTFKTWMESLKLYDDQGQQLIEVTPVSNKDYNANPLRYLKNNAGEWQYDVIMSGSWDANNNVIMGDVPAKYIQEFIESGRGVLFGHDTVTGNLRGNTNYRRFAENLGVTWTSPKNERQWTGSTKIKLINNGYLMKYPFEMKENVVLTIPYAHNIELQNKAVGTVWLEFIEPSGSWSNRPFDNGVNRGGWYLKTNGNVGMIQTGHSNGQSTMDERKIIANVLYNLAQVSMENQAEDQSVSDDQLPISPTLTTSNGSALQLEVDVASQDVGKTYQWYVEANTKHQGVLRSDQVEETVTSNIAGYIYRINDQPTFNLKAEVEREDKDEFGRIPKERYSIYVAPGDGAADYDNYETNGAIKIKEAGTQENKFLHVVAVDRGNNVSEVTTSRIGDLLTEFIVTERYLDDQGTELRPETSELIKKGEKYEKKFSEIATYERQSYQIDGEQPVEVTDNETATIPQVLKNRQVLYLYNKPLQLNIRHLVLNKQAEIGIPKQGQINLWKSRESTEEDPLSKQMYKVNMGDQSDNIDFTQVVLTKQKEYPYFRLRPLEPSLYRYTGAVITNTLTVHDPSIRVMDDINLPVQSGERLWISFYFEPNLNLNIYLAIVNDRLVVYYANVEQFKVKIDGEEYKIFDVKKSPVQESQILEIPVNQFKHKVSVEFQDEKGQSQKIYWNDSLWDFVE